MSTCNYYSSWTKNSQLTCQICIRTKCKIKKMWHNFLKQVLQDNNRYLYSYVKISGFQNVNHRKRGKKTRCQLPKIKCLKLFVKKKWNILKQYEWPGLLTFKEFLNIANIYLRFITADNKANFQKQLMFPDADWKQIII